MKITAVMVILAVVLVVNTLPVKAGVDDFYFDSMNIDYHLSRSPEGYARMSTAEELVAIFPEYDQNHGILRAIPQTYGDMPLEPTITTITDAADTPLNFTTYTQNKNLVIKIGDSDTFVHGRTIYQIEYDLKNVITFYDDHDELFWNINGTQWPQSFDEITARVYIPADLAANLQSRQLCYSGTQGSLDQDCIIKRELDEQGNAIISVTANNLGPYENLSFVIGWDKGVFKPDPWPRRWELLRWGVGGLLPIIALAEMTRRWMKYGRDPTGRGIIIPQYTPPENMNPLEADTVMNEKLRTSAVSAALIDLARRGYITIHETTKKKLLRKKTDYELKRTKQKVGLSLHDQEVLDLVFKDSTENSSVKLAEQANKLYNGVQKLQTDLPRDLTTKGYFRHDPNSTRTRYYVAGGILTGLPVLILAFAPWLALGLIAGGIVVLLFAGKMPAKTKSGVELRDYLFGLKEYIALAEVDRIKFHQSPEGIKQYGDPTKPAGKIKLFEALLPYAMLFGQEKDWAKQFEHLYKAPPDWYSGTGHFSAMHLANSVRGVESQAARAFTAPGGSSGSGFSGGGGSGGGGGGGGGGGW